MKRNILLWSAVFNIIFISCNSPQKKLCNIIEEWKNRQILYPSRMIFSSLEKDSFIYDIPKKEYSIISYVDSMGCISCKLNLLDWKYIIKELKMTGSDVNVLLFFHISNKQEVYYLLKRDSFNYPVCIDIQDSLNKLNGFPTDMAFQTFLLDKNNKVVAVGNPILNPKIRELYLSIIQGKSISSTNPPNTSITTVSLSNRLFKLGTFPWQQPQTATFSFKNTGTLPLVIQDVSTSCGCTTVEYDPKPVQPGGSLDIQVTYKAEHPEHFDKTVTVYCNAEDSPIVLKIQGNAE